LPYTKGRKNDTASVLEATVDYVKCIREKLPPAIMDQVFTSQNLDLYAYRHCFPARILFLSLFIIGNVCVFVHVKNSYLSLFLSTISVGLFCFLF
jgi:hypothetical protein